MTNLMHLVVLLDISTIYTFSLFFFCFFWGVFFWWKIFFLSSYRERQYDTVKGLSSVGSRQGWLLRGNPFLIASVLTLSSKFLAPLKVLTSNAFIWTCSMKHILLNLNTNLFLSIFYKGGKGNLHYTYVSVNSLRKF